MSDHIDWRKKKKFLRRQKKVYERAVRDCKEAIRDGEKLRAELDKYGEINPFLASFPIVFDTQAFHNTDEIYFDDDIDFSNW